MTQEHTQTLVAEGLTKRYGRVTAVADMSFTVRPGAVTGFSGRTGRARPRR
jgi:ABC-2 type transport system ATP-binding protein